MSTTYTQTELQAKKVPDLKAILTQLGASTAGVKADLVARILESQSSSSSSKTDLPAAGNALGSIPAENELPSSNGGTTRGDSANDASASTSVPTSGSGAADSATANGADGSKAGEVAANLPASTDKQSEAEKRANRLKRFGNEEELAKLERAERFGTTGANIDDKSVSKLDSELSNKRMRKNEDAPSATKANGKPKLERTKSNSGKPQSKGQANKPQSNAGKPKSTAAAPAAKVLDPEEEAKRKKRAERFNAPKPAGEAETKTA